MKYCKKCGKDLVDEAEICIGCGCSVTDNPAMGQPIISNDVLINKLSERLKTEGIIWVAIGAVQILGGLFFSWWMLTVGVLNIISAINDINQSKAILTNRNGIVKSYEPITLPIITLFYNLFFGGVIGVVGSIYYFVAIRGFVMENRAQFDAMKNI